MPKVSVIIVTYNRSNLLGAAITSVLNQTFQDYEIIVVDDASNDNTGEIVQAFNDKRIRYIRHQTNRKVAGARNTGVQSAKGEYIAFLDDDDEWLPEKLQRQVDLLDSSVPMVGGVYTGFLKINRVTGKTLVRIIPSKRGTIFKDLVIGNFIGTASTVLLKKECFEKVGLFDENIGYGEDYDMWVRVSKDFHLDYIKEPLVKYYVHDRNLSTEHDIVIRGSETIIRKYKHLFALDRKHYSDRYYGIGVCYCLAGEARKGRRALLKAIRLYPFDLRCYFRFSLSLLGAENFKKASELRDRVNDWVKKR